MLKKIHIKLVLVPVSGLEEDLLSCGTNFMRLLFTLTGRGS